MSMAPRAPLVRLHYSPCSIVKCILTRPKVNFPASPLQSEGESVTPRSQPYPSTPPVLDADIFDTVPFSVRTHRGAYQHKLY